MANLSYKTRGQFIIEVDALVMCHGIRPRYNISIAIKVKK